MDKKAITLEQMEEALRDMTRWIQNKLKSYIAEPAAEGRSGWVLTTNGAGGRSWEYIPGAGELPDKTLSIEEVAADAAAVGAAVAEVRDAADAAQATADAAQATADAPVGEEKLANDVKRRFPAVNLLDNSDFRNPVNQRCNASYSGNKTTIDRWYMWNSSANGSLTTEDGYITTTAALYQYLEKVKENTVYTLAVKYLGEEPYVISHTFEDGINDIPTNFYIGSKISVRLGPGNIEWAALYEGEYTADTLPEYIPKGYGAELAECQRYYQRSYETTPKTNMTTGTMFYGYSASKYSAGTHFFPAEMRKTPTVTIYSPGSGATGKVESWSGDDISATVSATPKGFQVRGGSTGTLAANTFYVCHYEASADL